MQSKVSSKRFAREQESRLLEVAPHTDLPGKVQPWWVMERSWLVALCKVELLPLDEGTDSLGVEHPK